MFKIHIFQPKKYDFQTSRVIGPCDHKDLVSAKNKTKYLMFVSMCTVKGIDRSFELRGESRLI